MEDFMSNISKPKNLSTSDVEYYSNFENLEVNIEGDGTYELYDSSDDNMIERDHLDITEFCMSLDSIEVIDDMMFNYLEEK
jgi:hypothetical protein|tara:strand:+ start:96 stop:338 length:243 start_codon:yes stop_codon:yes gene_type:complete